MSLNATIVIASWTALGAVVGATLGHRMWSNNTTPDPPGAGARSPPSHLAAGVTATTALLFGGLAWHRGPQGDLLAYSVLAATAVPLSLIDWYELRLPRRLVLPLYPALLGLFGAAAVLERDGAALVRGVGGMAVLASAYLATAILSRGGVGAGDVLAAGPVGLALAWLSWPTLLTGTVFSLAGFAAMVALLRIRPRPPVRREFPFGPAMFAGTFLAVLTQ